MTNQNNAAQAADTTPFSDEYVNAVIQQHGYDSPECVIARLHQWIGLHGGENGVILLMYEAHKALVKLRAPVADERAAELMEEARSEGHSSVAAYVDQLKTSAATYRQERNSARDAVARYREESTTRAPVADERPAQEYGSPADVAQRIEQYLAHDGRMNSGTQLLYEAMKALRGLPRGSK